MATLVELDGVGPTIGRDVFLAPTAVLAAGAVVPDRGQVGPGILAPGVPARDKALEGATREHPQRAADEYRQLRARYPAAATTTA
jgi:carbonic anhydrase/acetyltransferase-like protein (isoleucine patch superfamily)